MCAPSRRAHHADNSLAGWSAAIVSPEHFVRVICGPVVCDPRLPAFLGAMSCSSNTADFTGLAEALRWANSFIPRSSRVHHRFSTIQSLESMFAVLFKNAGGDWEPAVKTNASQNRCRVFRKSPWWDLSCDDDIWLCEQATMNRAQNSFVDEHLEQVQSTHDELRCYFADHKTMQIRPATTYDLSDKSRICLLDLRDAPNCELEAIRQHISYMKPCNVDGTIQ